MALVTTAPAGTAAATRPKADWLPAVAILCGLAALVLFTMRDLIVSGEYLPGTDSGILHAWETYTRSVLATGQLPHWNPYQFGGVPHLADTQTTVLYPPALLLRWLPPVPFLVWMAVFHLWLSGAGALFFARTIGLGWLASAAAAVAVTLGGSIGAWLYGGYLLLIYCAAWLPWALGFAVLSWKRARYLPHPGLVIVLVCQFLAGYLQGALYVTAAVCAGLLFNAVWPGREPLRATRWQSLVQLAGLGALTAGVSAFQLLPAAVLVSEAGRTAGLPYRDTLDGAWSVANLARFFFPFQGIDAEPVHRYLADNGVYVGLLFAALIPVAFLDAARRRVSIFLGLLALCATALALGDSLPLYRLHYELMPGLRRPGRALFVVTLAIAMLGAIGLERFVELSRARKWRLLSAAMAVALAVGALCAFVAWPAEAAVLPPGPGWPALPAIALAGIAVIAWLASRVDTRAALACGLALVVCDVTVFSSGGVRPVELLPEQSLQQWMGAPEQGRAVSFCENIVGPNELLRHRQTGMDGLGGVYLSVYADYAYVARFGSGPPGDGLFRRLGSDGPLPARSDLLSAANVRTVISCQPVDAFPGLRLISKVESVSVYRNDAAWPRAVWTCDAGRRSREDVVSALQTALYDDRRQLVRRTLINVRWTSGLPEQQRRDIEMRRGLTGGVAIEEDTWRYVLGDSSTANVIGLIQEASIIDTHGIDRSTGAVLDAVGEQRAAGRAGGEQMAVGSEPCDASGEVAVQVQDRPDGLTRALVDASSAGLVFLSEARYPERQAFVDGEPVEVLTANLAFTAIPVPAGRHVAELRLVPRSFHAGLAVTVLTLVVWFGLVRAGRRGRRRA